MLSIGIELELNWNWWQCGNVTVRNSFVIDTNNHLQVQQNHLNKRPSKITWLHLIMIMNSISGSFAGQQGSPPRERRYTQSTSFRFVHSRGISFCFLLYFFKIHELTTYRKRGGASGGRSRHHPDDHVTWKIIQFIQWNENGNCEMNRRATLQRSK